MLYVTPRFYANLNDFLPSSRQQIIDQFTSIE